MPGYADSAKARARQPDKQKQQKHLDGYKVLYKCAVGIGVGLHDAGLMVLKTHLDKGKSISQICLP